MVSKNRFQTDQQIIWCPGCGNFGVFQALQNTLEELNLRPDQVLAVFGVGCHGHMANYLKTYTVEALHGRAIPLAMGVKLANNSLTVLAIAGDGDQLGEGGNHLIHACRKNPDIKCLIHNNQLYSLTVGQASPTSDLGTKTKTTPDGVFDQPLNSLTLALASGASFVARGFAGNVPQLTRILIEAIKHKGFAVIDILQPCPSLNKANTFQWFQQRVYELGKNYNFKDKNKAFEKALEWGEKIPIGIFYQENRPTLEDHLLPVLKKSINNLFLKTDFKKLIAEFR